MPPALIVFLKAPRPGMAKTRLTPFLTPTQAASLARCLARDCLALAWRSLPDNGYLIVAYAPDNALLEIVRLLPVRPTTSGAPTFVRQHGSDLGERMANAAGEAFAAGLAPLVLIGIDCPFLSSAIIDHALDRLTTGREVGADVVLGPAEDGGYYLLGLRGNGGAAVPSGLFDDIPWSTSAVFSQTAANAARLDLRLDADLPTFFDIDMPADLIRLRRDLAVDPALREQAPATARWFQDNLLPSVSGAEMSGEVERP